MYSRGLCIGLMVVAQSTFAMDWLKKPQYRSDAHKKPLFSKPATKNPTTGSRCAVDSLSIDQARARLKWATECRVISRKQVALLAHDFDDDLMPVPAARPRYPIFVRKGAVDDVKTADIWIPNLKTCKIPAKIVYASACESSCYTPDQKLLTPTGALAIAQAQAARIKAISVLARHATLDHIALVPQPIGRFISSIATTRHQILDLTMASGGTLRVTPNHPVVLDSGKIVDARHAKVGRALIHYKLGSDQIIDVQASVHVGRVYNVEPSSRDHRDNIVVVQSYLNGSNRYQNQFADKMTRIQLRASVDDALVSP
jgi:hypothetical protein